MRLVMILTSCLLSSFALLANDWTQWRGPDRAGQVKSFKGPSAWPASLTTLWEVDAGEGYSGPLVQGERIFVFSREGTQEQVAAYALKDGKQLWTRSYSAPFTQSDMARMHGNGPFATPTIAGSMLITIGMTEILSAFDLASGELKWQIDFIKDHKGGGNVFGSASSPLVTQDRCLVQVAKNKGGALYCINVRTGEILWQRDNQGQASTPLVVADLNGEKQVIAKSSKGLGGFRLNDGEPLWHTEYRIRYDHPIVTPILDGNHLYLGDYSRETTKWLLKKEGGKWGHEVVWENPDVNFYMASPVKLGDRIFGFSNKAKGTYVCLDTTTGKTLWASDGRMGENAMLIGGGEVVFGLTPDGQLRVIDTKADTFKLFANYKVSELPTWGPPVILEQGLLVKDTKKLKRLAW